MKVAIGDHAPELAGATAAGVPFDLAAPGRTRAVLVEFHRGTW